MLYGLMALGLVLLYKGTRVLNFAHGEMALFSTFVGYSVTVTLHLHPAVALVAAVLVGAVLGYLVDRLIASPLGEGNMLAKAIATLGLFLALGTVMRWIWFADPKSMPGLFPDTSVKLGTLVVSATSLGVLCASLISLVVLVAFFRLHPLGLLIRATADDSQGAELIGIDPKRINSVIWILSSALGALAGMMFVPTAFIGAGVMTPVLLKGIAAAVVGGFDSLPGAVIGGLIIGLGENILAYQISPEWKTPFAFIVLLAVLLIAPQGLIGQRRRRRV